MNSGIRTALATAAAAAGVFLLVRSLTGDATRTGVFFYDESARRLFVAPMGSVPPIAGVDGPDADAFRAVVVSVTGNPDDKASRRIAYLERYSPEMKAQIEAAQAGGPTPAIGRSEGLAHRWVRRTNDTEWIPMADPRSEEIVSGWAVPGPAGETPVLCTP